MNTLDQLVLAFTAADAAGYVVLWHCSSHAVVDRLGAAMMSSGIYFLLRSLIRDDKDVIRAITTLSYVCALIALVMLVEHISKQNPYMYLGGSRAWTRDALMLRDGRLRAMGPFQHPILAGSFGATCFPLFVGLWFMKRRLYATIGALSTTIIVVAAASSTPILAYAAAVIGVAFWPFRRHLRALRWIVVLCLVALQLVMKAPVWALIQRADVLGGSSGFHRYYLVDQFIRRFGEWFLCGVKDTHSWGPDMWDHANQYVAVGTTSGMLPLILFVAVAVYGFKAIGVARRRQNTRKANHFTWILGAAVLAHLVAFFGISYVDQTIVGWWGVLAMAQGMMTVGLQRNARGGSMTVCAITTPRDVHAQQEVASA